MRDRHAPESQIEFPIPEPPPKQRVAPADWHPIEDLPELTGVVALDFETDDPGIANKLGSSWARPGEGSVCGFGLAPIYGEAFYCAISHGCGNGDGEKYVRWLAAQAAKPDVTFVYANAIYDLGWLLRLGIDPVNHPIDIQGMAALLDENRTSYSLDSLLWAYLKRGKATEGLRARAREYGITNPYLHMRTLPAWDVAQYGTDDVKDTMELYQTLLPLLEEQNLGRVFALERECLLVGRDLRWRGVRVDQDALAQVERDFAAKRGAAIIRIKDATGVNVTAWDNAAIARALEIEQPNYDFERTSKGAPSIRAALLEAMQTPVADAVREMRQYDKAISTTLAGMTKYITKGRIHGEFHPLRRTDDEDGATERQQGTVTGRWSSSAPNLQNIPRRVPKIGDPIRSCFLPEEGELWAKLDYSSQEPRLATHFASLVNLVDPIWLDRPRNFKHLGKLDGADEMVAKYIANPNLSMHKETAELMGIDWRKDEQTYDRVKAMNLGLIYGMQGKRFCQEQGLPTKWITTRDGREIEVAGDEGQELLDRHFRAVPWVKQVQNVAQYNCDDRGYALTISGRRVRFERFWSDGRRMNTYKALNASVQGSAADQMKYTQCAFRRAGIYPLVVVHDDANLSIERGVGGVRRIEEASEIMANAVKLVVPSLAEASVGTTWGTVTTPEKMRPPRTVAQLVEELSIL